MEKGRMEKVGTLSTHPLVYEQLSGVFFAPFKCKTFCKLNVILYI